MTKGQERLSRGHSPHARDVPQFPVYVTMTDRFMGGWGPALRRTNRHIILCDDWTTGGLVAEAARSRPEMSRVSISADRPRQRAHTLFSWSGPDGWITKKVPEPGTLAARVEGRLDELKAENARLRQALDRSALKPCALNWCKGYQLDD